VPAGDYNQRREFGIAIFVALLLHGIMLWKIRIHLHPGGAMPQAVMRLHLVQPPTRRHSPKPVLETPPQRTGVPRALPQTPPGVSVDDTAKAPPPGPSKRGQPSVSRQMDLTVIAPRKPANNANRLAQPQPPSAMYLHRPLLKPQRAFTALPKNIWRPTRIVSVDSYYSSDGTPESVTVMDNGDIVICHRQRYLFDKALDGAQLGLCFTVQDQW